MKRETQQGLVIGAIVLLILFVIGIGWRSLSASSPAPEKLQVSELRPDPVPQGMSRDAIRSPQSGSESPK